VTLLSFALLLLLLLLLLPTPALLFSQDARLHELHA
jgi:hypothetical protein